MLEAVDAVLLRLEAHERVEEVGLAEAALGPALEVDRGLREVLGVVRELRGELADARGEVGDEGASRVVVAGVLDRAVLGLHRLQRRGGGLDAQPGGVLAQVGGGGLGHRHGSLPAVSWAG